MQRTITALLALLLLATIPTTALAQSYTPDAPGAAAPEDPFKIDLHGWYSIWALSQRNFFLGKPHPLDDGDYVVQNFRLQLTVGTRAVYGQLRLDAAQGWWGTDNSPNVGTAVGTDDQGQPVGTPAYNPDGLFGSKDTNYAIHVDHAFLDFALPPAPMIRMRAGRMPFLAGHKLVLDQDYDGVQVTAKVSEVVKLGAGWAKVSEGKNSARTPVGGLLGDGQGPGPEDDVFMDADLLTTSVQLDHGDHHGEAFALFYFDYMPDFDHFPQGLGYFHARFQPQVSKAMAFGVAAHGRIDVLGGLKYRAEVDMLAGEDDVDNADFAGGLLDRNDGKLRGFNALADASLALGTSIPVELGVLVGIGSGDDDPTGGPGNLNRIQTMGTFALTNVWEDSVMPDVGGITPQGLGSPASRGYRELENTTVAQLRVGFDPTPWLHADASYTFLQATAPVHGFDATGTPTDETASDLGQEFDLNLKLKIYDSLVAVTQMGILLPGQAASLLITGGTEFEDRPWEIKQVLLYTF